MEPIKCPYCKRKLSPWPVYRPGTCSPKTWTRCIRNRPSKKLSIETIKMALATCDETEG